MDTYLCCATTNTKSFHLDFQLFFHFQYIFDCNDFQIPLSFLLNFDSFLRN